MDPASPGALTPAGATPDPAPPPGAPTPAGGALRRLRRERDRAGRRRAPLAASLALHAGLLVLLQLARQGEPGRVPAARSSPVEASPARPAFCRELRPRPEPIRPELAELAREPEAPLLPAPEPLDPSLPGDVPATEGPPPPRLPLDAASAWPRRRPAPPPSAPALAPTPPAPEAAPPGEEERPPEVLERVEPRYPARCRRLGHAGTAVVRLLVLEDGTPGEATLVASAGCQDLDQAALTAALGFRFAPARRGGRPVPRAGEVAFHFRPE